MDVKTKISTAYDKMANVYFEKYPLFDPQHKRLLDFVIHKLGKAAKILDLGCGPGIPYTRYLSERFDTTAVDFSKTQIRLAKKNAPKAKYILSDISNLELTKESFDLVTAFYSLIHIPIKEQPKILKKVFGFLKQGGYFLLTVGYKKWVGKEENWLDSGETMYWSHLGKEENLKMLKKAGFKIVRKEIENDQVSVEGRHFVILCRKT